MRGIKYNIQGQSITQDPSCDFSGLIPGTNGYLTAEFTFSSNWDGFRKVAKFTSGNHEYTPQLIDDNDSCQIPLEALQRSIFYIQILGKKGQTKLVTNKIAVVQDGGL